MSEEMSFEELQEIVSFCLDEIEQLKAENNKLQSKNAEQQMLLDQLIQLNRKMNEQMNHFKNRLEVTTEMADNIRYERADPRKDKTELMLPRFYPAEKTIDELVYNKKSMARFGDGEFAIMENCDRQKFQRPDMRLSARLKEVIISDEENFCVAIADNYGCLDAYTPEARRGIRFYMSDKVRAEHAKYLSKERIYHDAYISRPYVLYADNHTDAPRKRFDSLKRIWDKRNVIMVEGSQTRLGVGNDLFDNAGEIRRIEAPPTNSFDKYDEILAAALKFAEPDTLFLIALGPAAGVLAYDLYKQGYQAIDIGHIDLEYEWFLAGTGQRSAVPNKYNNECEGGDQVEDIKDEKYESEIICRINA